jgi:hypothetical protein
MHACAHSYSLQPFIPKIMTELYKRRQINKAAKLLNEGNIQGFKVLEDLIEKEKNELTAVFLERLTEELKLQITTKP